MPTATGTSDLQWETVSTGVWIGRADGRFCGVIEGRPGVGFVANTPTGERTCDSLDEAKASFERR